MNENFFLKELDLEQNQVYSTIKRNVTQKTFFFSGTKCVMEIFESLNGNSCVYYLIRFYVKKNKKMRGAKLKTHKSPFRVKKMYAYMLLKVNSKLQYLIS